MLGGTRDQKRLQQEIAVYKGRVSLSPAVEEQYKQLTRDYDNAQKDYQDLLAKKSTANLTVKMTNAVRRRADVPAESGEPAGRSELSRTGCFLPEEGLGAGLALGLGLAFLLELTRQLDSH